MSRAVKRILGASVALAATVMLAALPGEVRAQSPNGGVLNHFQCYEIRPPGQFDVGGVDLVDEFGSSTVSLKKAFTVCAPADKNGEDPTASTDPDHLASYGIRRAGARFPRVSGLQVTDQFGTLALDVTKPARLMVPSAKSLAGPPSSPVGSLLDHFQCYKAKRTRGAAKFSKVLGVDVTTQFESASIDLVRPLRLCAPVDKNGESPGAETHPEHLLCYRVRSQTGFPTRLVFLNNQFGQQTYQIAQRREFCVPSSVTAAPTTTTTSSSPDTTATTTSVPPSTSTSSTSSSTSTSTSSTSSTSTTLPCECPAVTRYTFSTVDDLNVCGQTQDAGGATLEPLGCTELHTGGGGSNTPPAHNCDNCDTVYKIDVCSATTLTLSGTSQAEASDRTCSDAGCLYHSPTPILNGGVSLCSASKIAQDAVGTVDCSTGDAFIDLPLAANEYLVGDGITGLTCVGGPNAGMACAGPGGDAFCGDGGFCPTGFQPCPICTPDSTSVTGSRCHGPNFGPFAPYFAENQPCVPGTTDLGEAHPTSWDCPPPQGVLGVLPIPFELTTGMSQKADPLGQFCRFCRDSNGAGGAGGYGLCMGGSNDGNPCSVHANCPMGTCGGEVACTSNADCPTDFCDDGTTPCHTDADCVGDGGTEQCDMDTGAREECTQRSVGAFGKATAVTITENGTSPGDLTDLLSHSGGLVSVFCIPPTYNAIVDGVGSVPGPGSVSYRGSFVLSPGGAFLD